MKLAGIADCVQQPEERVLSTEDAAPLPALSITIQRANNANLIISAGMASHRPPHDYQMQTGLSEADGMRPHTRTHVQLYARTQWRRSQAGAATSTQVSLHVH